MFEQFRLWLVRWLMPAGPPLLAPGRDAPTTIEGGAAELVERAREGDQNAMAMICEVRDRVKKQPDNQRAKRAFKALHEYIKTHPVVTNLQTQIESGKLDKLTRKVQQAWFNGDVETSKVQLPLLAAKSLPKAIVAVAEGPQLKNEYLAVVVDSMNEPEQKAFMFGFKHGMEEMEQIPDELKYAFLFGHILGTARKIQICRKPNAPLSILSPAVGLEFGEDCCK